MKHLVITLMIAMLAGVAYAQNPKRSELTIVAKVDVALTATEARHNNTSQRVSIDLTDALAKLGGGGLGMALHKFYIAEYDPQTEGKTDELTSTYNYRNGWWLTEAYDENTGEVTGECVADTTIQAQMYVRNPELDEKQLYVTVGQVGRQLLPGKTYRTSLYYINGSKAIEICLSLNTTEAPALQLSELEKAGEENASLSIYYNGSYKYRLLQLNADSIYQAIYAQMPLPDCVDYEEGLQWGEGESLVLYATGEDNTLTDDATANYGGYWLNTNGLACEWGAAGCAMFCEPDYYSGLSSLHVGIYPDRSLIDTSVKSTLYLVCGNFYYQLNLKVAIGPQPTFAECQTVEEINYAMEMVPINKGGEELLQEAYMNKAIDLTDIIRQAFDSEDITFCTPVYVPGQGYSAMPSANNITGTVISDSVGYLNGYQMTDIRALAEDDNSFVHVAAPFNPSIPILTIAYGIGYKDGTLSFWQKDGVREVGDYYTAEYYLYSLDDKKKVKLNINVIYVSERNPVEIVKTTDITLPSWNAEKSDYAATQYDLSEVLDSLQCDDAGKIVWMAYNNLYQLTVPSDYDELAGFVFSSDGRLLPEDLNGAVFIVGYIDGEFHSFVMNPSDDSEHTTAIVATYNGKGYRFNITVTPTPDTGIASLPFPFKGGSQGYNLSGMHMNTNTLPLREGQGVGLRGIYIIDGKKVLVR
jgi:hypothetical protein